ncbi:MAG: YbjQ family protein [Planctomycetota bacterium]|jgi:uncharacterized protein YbjQ (UPF0145 family)|nr:hypothetical protein [Planctomycetota bacterium]MDP6520128.1 YbjQ family protein [Planctomycetota bacterium]MDP6837599.1 YbjQ family protein [Planctomycetota bacterium]MDP6956481.1 YbjQ family protein [Planctomycetota bacterium]
MIITTTDTVPGREITELIGLARGNTVRARHAGKDIGAFFKNLVGGEIEEYTKLLAESREQALDRMVSEATALGADAIVNMRFATSLIAQGAAEFLCYGTAVRLAPE